MNKTDIAKLLKQAASYCEKAGVRFTEPRQYVLEIMAAAKKPMGAYDILAALGTKIDNPKPPTAYRAIEFLEEHGFIHCIESLNAYVLCGIDHRHTGSQFMICDSCGTVTEAHLCHLPDDLAGKINDAGFHIKSWNAELHGFCKDCFK